MKLLTWNVYRHNPCVRELFDEARSTAADILCFQEVRESDIELLSGIFNGFHVFKCRQFFIKKSERSICLYNVILSRYPFINCFAVQHATDGLRFPPRYRLSYSGLLLEFAVADFMVDGIGVVRMFNLHLECVAPPSVRLARLRQVHELFLPGAMNVVMGDFNTFMNPLLAPFVAALYGNFQASDFFCFEARLIQEACVAMKLQNPFAGVRTFKYSASQYDHILVPAGVNCTTRERIGRLSGSDHFGLCLDLAT